MDGITQLIVDMLRKKQEEAALQRGGPTAGVGAPQRPPASTPPFAMPVGREPKHGGKTYDEILAEMGG